MKRYDTSSHMADTHAMLNEVIRERDWLIEQKILQRISIMKEPVIWCDVCKETGGITVQAILSPSNDNEG
jgi:hypothetical protein